MDRPPAQSTVLGWIQAHAQTAAESPALVFGDTTVTYGELVRRANQLANAMRTRGVGPEARVAISIGRSPDVVIAMLAVLVAGGAYVPLDPTYPADRLRYMLDDARPALLVTQAALEASVATGAVPVLRIDADRDAIAAHGDSPPVVDLAWQNLAYVIYTSGSTGRPKGTLLQHGGLANLVANQIRILGLDASSRVVQFAPLSFDASVWETFATLAAGGTLVLATAEDLLPGKELTMTLRRHAVTHATLPPSVLAVLRDTELPALATVVSAGEACSTALVERWGAGRRFINAYGPTESTVCATYTVLAPGDRITIGRALDGIAVYVLDDRGHRVTSASGELFLGGAGLARGYHGRAALTAERFVPDPYSREPGARMYRTGDHARQLDDGALDFIGRVDDQVKIRGFRIELGEVESALRAHPGVRHAVAAAHGSSPQDMRLIGYVVAAAPPLATADVVAFLERTLPPHMVPSAIVVLDAFPMTPAGKIDRQALPAPSAQGDAGDVDEGLAATIATLFAEVLDVERVGVEDNFFELGGHSLLAAQLVARMEEVLGREVPLTDVFDAPTPAELARRLAPPADDDAVARTIAGLFSELLEHPSIGLDDNFFELGGHSLLAAQLVGRIDEVLHVELPLSDVFDSPTPRELAAIVIKTPR